MLHIVSSLPTSGCNFVIIVSKHLTKFNPRQMWQYSCEKNTKLKITEQVKKGNSVLGLCGDWYLWG